MRVFSVILGVAFITALFFAGVYTPLLYFAAVPVFCFLIAGFDDNPGPACVWAIVAILVDGVVS